MIRNMKKHSIILIFTLVIFVSSFQCNKCIDLPDQILDDSRQWLPLRGLNQLRFSNQFGIIDTFNLSLEDTFSISVACTGKAYKDEYINGRLLLDNSGSDFISFGLNQKNFFCINAVANLNNELNQCDILKKAGATSEIVNLLNYTIGGTIYSETILLKSNTNNSTIDSIFIAKNKGIARFKYNGLNYVIQ